MIEEYKLPQNDPASKIELTKKEYEKLNDDLAIAQLQLQETQDTLNGGITARNMANFRNTYIINVADSLDDSYPLLVRFRVLDETVKIVSVKVSYWIDNFRAFSKAAAEAEATTSGATGSSSGGGVSSQAGGVVSSGSLTSLGSNNLQARPDANDFWTQDYNVGDDEHYMILNVDAYNTLNGHKHLGGSHTHYCPNHTHPNHTHTIPAHSHDITYGIYEEDTTPTIKFSVSQDGGVAYGQEYANLAIDRELIDITEDITTTGSKIIKFESTARTRLTVQVEVKVDISVR